MKRSEALSRIDFLLSTCHPEEFPSTEDLLRCVESFMLPPNEIYVSCPCALGGTFKRQWEPEENEK